MKVVLLVLLLSPSALAFQDARTSADPDPTRARGWDVLDQRESCLDDPITADGELIKPTALLELEEQYRKSPYDAEVTRQLVAASFDLANRVLYASCASPTAKYLHAIRLLGLVTELDPAHEDAREVMADIHAVFEAVYRHGRVQLP
jgi:hypothetical protein